MNATQQIETMDPAALDIAMVTATRVAHIPAMNLPSTMTTTIVITASKDPIIAKAVSVICNVLFRLPMYKKIGCSNCLYYTDFTIKHMVLH